MLFCACAAGSETESGSSSSSSSGGSTSSSSSSSSDSSSPSGDSVHETGTDWDKEEVKRSMDSSKPEKYIKGKSESQLTSPKHNARGKMHSRDTDGRNTKRIPSKKQDIRSSSVESRGRWEMK